MVNGLLPQKVQHAIHSFIHPFKCRDLDVVPLILETTLCRLVQCRHSLPAAPLVCSPSLHSPIFLTTTEYLFNLANPQALKALSGSSAMQYLLPQLCRKSVPFINRFHHGVRKHLHPSSCWGGECQRVEKFPIFLSVSAVT
jgi:hypothetical protein